MDTKKIVELIERHIGKKAVIKPFGRTEHWVLSVPHDALVLAATLLRQDAECRYDVAESVCTSIQGDKILLSYFLLSSHHEHQLVLRTELQLKGDSEQPAIESLSQVWSSLALQETEQSKLYGITFLNIKKVAVNVECGFSEGAFPLRKNYFWEETFI